ncbi:hypothetical protein F5887DRAFT_1201430 [Amanita rubescens]|nr:hypothetical protein F5887DRAFT_1201430 [Amanita rubescens]
MRLTSIALAFLFLINVLATPINLPHGNAVGLRRRSPNEHDTPGKVAAPKTRTTTSLQKGGNGSTTEKAAAKCKRATPNELLEAVRKGKVGSKLQESKASSVYHLTTRVDNEDVILKVVRGTGIERMKAGEAWALENVQQLLGWGYTPNEKLFYLFMKNMGVPLSQTGATFANDHQQVEKLQREAEKTYLSRYHLEHDDHDESPRNWAFRKVGGEWRAELVDWEFFKLESGYKGYKDPPAPFEIDPACGYFVPPMMERYIY